jgi:aspartyl/glutamyl-tRNA(Asn/Gln) amidotransferase C subunit
MNKKLLDIFPILEKLSLIKVTKPEMMAQQIGETVRLAEQLSKFDTEGVKPMYSVLEDHALRLREDSVQHYDRDEVQRNARKTFEGYFVVETEPGKRKKT